MGCQTPKDVLKFAKENKVEAVDLKFLDLMGIWQHFTIATTELGEDLFEEGSGFDGSSIRGWQPINASDMLVIPDATTAAIDPFMAAPTLSLICNIVDPITKEEYSRDPRNIARKAEAFLKSQLAAGVKLPQRGNVFISVRDADKPRAVELAKLLAGLGFTLVATRGTAAALSAAGVAVTPVNKVHEGQPHIVDMMKNDEIALVVNTVQEKRSAIQDSRHIRREALTDEIPTYTTIAGARAAALGLAGLRELVPYAIQTLHQRLH